MKKFLLTSALLFSTVALAQDFLPATDDVPLMTGLYSVEEVATFDNPSEKMVLITAQTDKNPDSVKSFYRQTLQNLGWTVLKNDNYVRGSDTLTMELTTDNKTTTIQFTLVQKN